MCGRGTEMCVYGGSGVLVVCTQGGGGGTGVTNTVWLALMSLWLVRCMRRVEAVLVTVACVPTVRACLTEALDFPATSEEATRKRPVAGAVPSSPMHSGPDNGLECLFTSLVS